MNREEVDHGSQGKGEEVEIKKEGQEGGGEKEDRCEALRAEEKIPSKEKESCTEESTGEKEISTEEDGTAKTHSEAAGLKPRAEAGRAKTRRAQARARSSGACGCRAAGLCEPDHLSPVQPTGGKRQSG